MKIVMLCYFFQDGLGFQENHLAREYFEAGHDVLILAPLDCEIFSYYDGRRQSGKKVIESQSSVGPKVVRLPYKNFSNLKYDPLQGVYAYLVQFQPDLIFVHGLSFNLKECVRYIKSRPQCKLNMDFHGDFSNSGKTWISRNVLHKVIKRFVMSKYKKYIDHVYAITPTSQLFLEKMYGLKPNEIQLLPLGGDFESASHLRQAGARQEIRLKLGLKPTDFLVFTGGKLEPFKKTNELIKSITLMNREDVHLVVVGLVPSKYEEYAAELLDLASLSSTVHMTGWIDLERMTSYMIASDCAVFPASQSVIWQQAIVSGLPLIVGESPGQSVTYLNHGNIMVFESDELDSNALATAILELRGDPERRLTMSKIAEGLAQAELDWVKIARKSLE